MRGRPANKPPALAYEYRRHITLIQVLAMDKSEGLKLTDLRILAEIWGLNPNGGFHEVLQRLAAHCIQYRSVKEIMT